LKDLGGAGQKLGRTGGGHARSRHAAAAAKQATPPAPHPTAASSAQSTKRWLAQFNAAAAANHGNVRSRKLKLRAIDSSLRARQFHSLDPRPERQRRN
jgi:hypothetical protein